MDQDTLVDEQLDHGQRLVERLVGVMDITAAAWIKTSEAGQWFLYIASKKVDDDGVAAAYRTVHSALRELDGLGVDRFDIKVIGAMNPIALDLIKHRGTYAGRTHYRGAMLGGVPIDEAYLLPVVRQA